VNLALSIGLSAAVPLRIAELQRRGGPTDMDFERIKSVSLLLCEKGDILQFSGGKKGEVASIFNQLADALSVMAFVPGGVSFDGQHFQADKGAAGAGRLPRRVHGKENVDAASHPPHGRSGAKRNPPKHKPGRKSNKAVRKR
jgi:hypothetical protein